MEDEERKRPAWVWVISIYIFVTTAFGLLGFYLILGSHMPIPAASRAVVDSMTSIDWSAVAVGMVLNVAGAVLLLMLRALAAFVFAAGLGVALLHTAWQLATGSPGVPSVWAMAIGFGISIAIVAYSFHLRDKGVLT